MKTYLSAGECVSRAFHSGAWLTFALWRWKNRAMIGTLEAYSRYDILDSLKNNSERSWCKEND